MTPTRSVTGALWVGLALGACVVLCVARAASAADVPLPGDAGTATVTFTQALVGDYHSDGDVIEGNPDSAYGDINSRTDIVLLHGSTSFNLRVDGTGFFGTEAGSEHQGRVGLEKVALSNIQRHFEVTAGDFYIRVGRGLLLDLTRVSEVFRDTTLRGGQVRLRHGPVSGVVFGGWVNPLDMDYYEEVPRRVPSDVIGGGRVEVQASRHVRAAAHYVGGGLQPLAGGAIRNATHSVGGSVELSGLFDRVNLYGEYDYMSIARSDEVLHGHGVYFSANGNFGALAALAEMKFYRHLLLHNDFGSAIDSYIYNRPPTLTRTKAEILNNHDVIGGRLRLDWRVGPLDTVLYANYGRFFSSDALGDRGFFSSGVHMDDIFGGIQQPLPGGALDLSAGYRRDLRNLDDGASLTDYSQLFADAELSVTPFFGHTIELELQYRDITKSAKSYWDFLASVGYRPSKYFALGGSYEYSNEFKDPDPTDAVTVRTHYGSVRATVNFTPSSFCRAFVGSTHGGVRCIDGFCREIPPFIGTKIELVIQL